jgi:tetratricopeptide (TPR) repeat protein
MKLESTKENNWGIYSQECRNSVNIGRDKFARVLGVSSRTILRWEKENTVPNITQQAKITFIREILHLISNETNQDQVLTSQEKFDILHRASYEFKKYEKTGTIFHETYKLETDVFFKNIKKYVDKEKWDDIYHLIKPIIDEFPTILDKYKVTEKIRILNWIGVSTFRQAIYKESLSFYKQAVKIANKDDKYLKVLFTNIGSNYLRLKDLKSASSYYKKALLIDPNFFPAHVNMITIDSLANQLDDAYNKHKKLLSIIENNNQKEELIQLLTKAIKEDLDFRNYKESNLYLELNKEYVK